LRKLHHSRSISSAGFEWSSELMVGGHSKGLGLQLVGARFLGHRLGDDLVDWNSGVSVRPSVRTSTKSFSDFHLIWCLGRPRPHMRTSVTSTRSMVKVKVTELPKLRKVHFSRSISATFACTSKLIVDSDTMAHDVQLVGVRFSNFFPGRLSREVILRRMSIFHEIQMAIFRYCVMVQSCGWACR